MKYTWGVRASILSLLALVSVGCDTPRAAIGEPCLTTFDCADDALCFGAADGQPVCMAPCDADERLCEGGEVCTTSISDPEARVCYIGGAEPLGDGCVGSDCAPGGTCIDVDGDGPEVPRCYQACDTRSPACPAGQSCIETGAPAGYCETTVE